MGKPDEYASEFQEDIRREIMRASGDEAHLRFEFLNGFIANGNPALGEVKTEKVEAFEKGNDFCFLWGKRKSQLGAEESIHKVQSLFSLSARAAQDHEIIGIAHEAEARLCQTLVEFVEDNIRQKRRNDPALRSA